MEVETLREGVRESLGEERKESAVGSMLFPASCVSTH